MDEARAARAIANGMMVVQPGIDVLCLGEMGIGNTTSASALCLALFGGTAEEWVGPGTGVAGTALANNSTGTARSQMARCAGLAVVWYCGANRDSTWSSALSIAPVRRASSSLLPPSLSAVSANDCPSAACSSAKRLCMMVFPRTTRDVPLYYSPLTRPGRSPACGFGDDLVPGRLGRADADPTGRRCARAHRTGDGTGSAAGRNSRRRRTTAATSHPRACRHRTSRPAAAG